MLLIKAYADPLQSRRTNFLKLPCYVIHPLHSIHCLGTFAVVCLMVGDATSRYVDAHPSLCEAVSYRNETNESGEAVTTSLDIADCPKALEVVVTITFATGLIMVSFCLL